MNPIQLKDRLDAAKKRRDQLLSVVQRSSGRLEEAEKALEALRSECRSKNLEPEKISEAISRFEGVLDDTLGKFEKELSAAETAMEPFTRK